ncbi:MAG: SET domain-containing protein [Parachlamydiales bacterium]
MQWSEFSFMLQPSPLGGVGVFATHDIPAGTLLFNQNFELRTMKVKDVPAALLKYCIYISDEECLCPERFDRMEIGWYINHSSTPNIARKNRVSNAEAVKNIKERTVHAVRDIKAGEEILIDYNCLDEPEHMKEDYYKPRSP